MAGRRRDAGKIGFVFQEPTLMPWADVAANVRLPLKLAHADDAQARAAVAQALARVGLAEFAQRYPRELSGGMKMRASIARALVTEPQLLLMDEPFAALDEITRFKLNNDLLALWQELRRTVIFVTHSVFESVYLSQRIVVMTPRPGRVFAEIAIPAPYPRDERFPHLGRLCRLLPAWCRRRWRRRWRRRAMSERVLAHRAAGPGARARSSRLWEAVGARLRHSALCAAGPGLVFATLIADGALLWHSLLVTLRHHLRRLPAGGRRRHRAGRPVQPVAAGRIFALSLRGHPAGDAGRRHRAAAC